MFLHSPMALEFVDGNIAPRIAVVQSQRFLQGIAQAHRHPLGSHLVGLQPFS